MKTRLNIQRCTELGVAMTAIAALIAGCGGGSSSPATTTLSGIVADGYLSGVKVCLDKNSNTVCDAGEPSAQTNASGAYSINGVTAADVAAYPVVAEVPATAVDSDTGSAVGQAFVLTTPAGQTFVSPLSSIMHQMLKDNPASSVADVTAQLKADMQLSGTFNPYADYIADAVSSSATSAVSATAHNFAQVVANSLKNNYSIASGVSDTQKGALQGTLVKIAKLAAQSQGTSPDPASVLGVEDFNTVHATLANSLTTGTASQAVTVNFDVMNGNTAIAACDAITLTNLQRWDQTPLTASPVAAATLLDNPSATQTTSGRMVDLRFYISNVLLWDASGNAVPLVMTEDAKQSKNVALMDFGYTADSCATAASGNDKHSITGNVVPGTYTGISFTVGVPVRSADLSTKLNHVNAGDGASPQPLQVTAMSWSWQGGRKFVKLDFKPDTPANKFRAGAVGQTPVINTHIGSTGCQGNPVVAGTETACTNANRLGVKFDTFNTASNVVELDVAKLFAGSDLTYEGGGAAGCMSGPTDPECAPIFKSLGLGLSGANAGRTLTGADAQTVFGMR